MPMPEPARRARYHHGDLRAALIDTAIELIGERGVAAFSLAEASRRLDVSVSAPYSHFADRDQLLAAVAVRAYGVFSRDLLAAMEPFSDPADRVGAVAGAYVRFAAAHRPLFQVIFEAGLDKAQHPEIEGAARPLAEAFLESAGALAGPEEGAAADLATAVAAIAHGHAALLLDGTFGRGAGAVDEAAERAAATTLAVLEGRGALRRAGR